MKPIQFIIKNKGAGFWLAAFLNGMLLVNCAHQKPQPTVSQYNFTLDNENYRIRSIISPVKSECYNEVIGQKFVAVDYDQDGVLDAVVMGDVALSEAQTIYQFGLSSLSRENKLKVRTPGRNSFAQEKDKFQLEIRSFRRLNAPPFNEFRVTDKRPLVGVEVVVLLDQNADGTLDEILMGSGSLEKFQSQYAEMIEAGLQSGELIKLNGAIVVKEK
ncbi:MAG: hypothetical protein ONB11_10650 [candidate division KSB1 bacterium]|nr:hypothetical protein [candidate division KSB1 bacterium]